MGSVMQTWGSLLIWREYLGYRVASHTRDDHGARGGATAHPTRKMCLFVFVFCCMWLRPSFLELCRLLLQLRVAHANVVILSEFKHVLCFCECVCGFGVFARVLHEFNPPHPRYTHIQCYSLP